MMNLKNMALILLIFGLLEVNFNVSAHAVVIYKLGFWPNFPHSYIAIHYIALFKQVISVAFLVTVAIPFLKKSESARTLLTTSLILFCVDRLLLLVMALYPSVENGVSPLHLFLSGGVMLLAQLLSMSAHFLFYYDNLVAKLKRTLILVPILMAIIFLYDVGSSVYTLVQADMIFKANDGLPIGSGLVLARTVLHDGVWLLFFISYYVTRRKALPESGPTIEAT